MIEFIYEQINTEYNICFEQTKLSQTFCILWNDGGGLQGENGLSLAGELKLSPGM